VKILARGSNFEITTDGRIVRCRVVNAPDIDPEEGARCARQIHDTLAGQVLTPGSPYAGLVFDVQLGPPVFGPKTRASLEELFRAAERTHKRLAIRVGSAAIQRLQFASLCRECAPTYASIADSDVVEVGWVRQGKPE
jgi:hypothetical protein